MKTKEPYPNRFSFYLYAMSGVIVLLGLTSAVLLREQARYQQATEVRALSLHLTEELRQSSTNLARLVSDYLITGNSLYRDYFNATVAIRDGFLPRPADYDLAYWELKAIEGSPAVQSGQASGEAVALLQLMRRAGFTEAEMTKLITAKASSNRLLEIEKHAITLIDTQPRSHLVREQALMSLLDQRVIDLRAQAMQPIIEAQQMVLQRTQQTVDSAQRRFLAVTLFLFLMTAALVLLILLLRRQIRRLTYEDLLTPIHAEDGNNRIASSQHQLASLNLLHYKAIVESSDDAIISKNTESIIASWNAGAERIFGYSAEEMIGTSIRRIIPEERAFEEDEILEKIKRGEKVSHFETQRRHRDGHLIDISATISPIYNEDDHIIGASKIARDITQTKATEAEIHRLAFYDTLTGLANRRLLIERLTQSMGRYRRDHTAFAVLFLDLDNFKTINDSLGHEAGDALLEEVGKRLRESLRETDTAARLGGDEFVLLINLHQIPASTTQWLNKVVEKVRERLAEPHMLNGHSLQCSASIGGVIYTGQTCTALELLQQADHAMYQAKHNGKNQFHLHDE